MSDDMSPTRRELPPPGLREARLLIALVEHVAPRLDPAAAPPQDGTAAYLYARELQREMRAAMVLISELAEGIEGRLDPDDVHGPGSAEVRLGLEARLEELLQEQCTEVMT